MDADLLPFFSLELDAAGTVCSSAGASPMIPDPLPEGITWKEFVVLYAEAQSRLGLEAGWSAIAEGRVAPHYWPYALPFRGALAARLRPVKDHGYVAQLLERPEPTLDTLIERQMLPVLDRLLRVGQHVSSGVDGPLTDRQVRDIQAMLRDAEQVRSLLEQVHAAQLAVYVTPPLPLNVHDLLSFSERDFSERRIETHRLNVVSELSASMVYCHAQLRDVVQRILRVLLGAITAETRIHLSDQFIEDEQALRVEIRYHCQEADFQVLERYEAHLPVIEVPPRRIQALVTMAHAYLAPVHGRAWAEPCTDSDSTTRLALLLPRWQDM